MLCKFCNIEQPEENFSWKFKNKTRHKRCRSCHKEYSKKHYNDNIDYYINKANKNRTNYIKINKNFINEYLKNNPCFDCGETNVLLLQFDHIELRPKIRVSNLVNGGCSIEAIKREIEKCQVRCANCHYLRTQKQRLAGW